VKTTRRKNAGNQPLTDLLLLADLLLLSVAQICDATTTGQIAQKFDRILTTAFPHDNPPKI